MIYNHFIPANLSNFDKKTIFVFPFIIPEKKRYMTSREIRANFLKFFENKSHKIVPSAPMVVKDDPTLMFTNAGMNQFKEWFLGNTTVNYKRVADTQKCLRVSGKHNDLEEVGHDSYHHTMFEMLGNWSFGDYFKKDAIEWAWELLTEVYKIDKERIYVTVFEGSKEDGTEADEDAKRFWRALLPDERIIYGNKKDNFWEMGESGPCGPCSEIHVDIRENNERVAVSGKDLVNKGHHLVIEIWNLVFIQYNRKADGTLELLPEKHVDTGMGLERLCMVMQGKKSNYDTDIFTGMISKISELSGKRYGDNEKSDTAMRVIADHIRAISFSIADGQLPSNVKAGYVIRRILRRAVRYSYTFLEIDTPFLTKLVSTLTQNMGDAFPELKSQQSLIEKVIKEEEEAFLRTLEKGIKLMDSLMQKNSTNKIISGADAFELYDTFGFPIDLSELIAKENGYTINLVEFELELQKQKERSRNATSKEEGDWIEVYPNQEIEFVGYDKLFESVKILRYREIKTKGETSYQLIFDKSPFYAESGGQVGDTGTIKNSDGEIIEITNTTKENNLNIHFSKTLPKNIKSIFKAAVDNQRRLQIANNHTATHLLHRALREILGTHIEQKGSLVSDTYFRFDFSHYEKLSDEQIKNVERVVNSFIRENSHRDEQRNVPIDTAKEMGAMALFGEKYGESVRVIKFADSIELCGGTHTESTGNIGYFKIISESAIAAGVRRIEATTGKYAEDLNYKLEAQIQTIKELLGGSSNLLVSIEKLISENDALKKAKQDFTNEKLISLSQKLVNEAIIVNGISIITLKGEFENSLIKDLAFIIKNSGNSRVFISGTSFEGKANLALLYSDDLVKRGKNAAKDIKDASSLILGGGGGQPFFASAGGKDVSGLNSAIEKLIETATKL